MVEGDEVPNDVIPVGNDDEEMTPKEVAILIGAILLIVGLPISISIYMGWAWYFCCSLMILPDSGFIVQRIEDTPLNCGEESGGLWGSPPV